MFTALLLRTPLFAAVREYVRLHSECQLSAVTFTYWPGLLASCRGGPAGVALLIAPAFAGSAAIEYTVVNDEHA